ncbi:hypothetical protein MKX03_023928 [Papaver bracteatum]|nr:hypothetical protein MKX03_023928 [Papaver bracteatum]
MPKKYYSIDCISFHFCSRKSFRKFSLYCRASFPCRHHHCSKPVDRGITEDYFPNTSLVLLFGRLATTDHRNVYNDTTISKNRSCFWAVVLGPPLEE